MLHIKKRQVGRVNRFGDSGKLNIGVSSVYKPHYIHWAVTMMLTVFMMMMTVVVVVVHKVMMMLLMMMMMMVVVH